MGQVPQAQNWVIERFGKFNRRAEPGLHFVIPFVETVACAEGQGRTSSSVSAALK